VAAPLAAAAVLLPFRGSWSNTNVALLLVVVVVAIASIGNRAAGGIAAIGAAIWFDFFFTLPYERFTIRTSADTTTAVLLLVIGLAVSQLAARARRLQVIAITDAGYLAQIHETASLAQTAKFPDSVISLPAEEVELRTAGNGQYFGRFMMKPNRGSKPSLQARLVAVTLADQAGRALAVSQPARTAQ
jgi:K+-sensing histidine kinase KdpD